MNRLSISKPEENFSTRRFDLRCLVGDEKLDLAVFPVSTLARETERIIDLAEPAGHLVALPR